MSVATTTQHPSWCDLSLCTEDAPDSICHRSGPISAGDITIDLWWGTGDPEPEAIITRN